jgi:hypothetical protein
MVGRLFNLKPLAKNKLAIEEEEKELIAEKDRL